MSKRTTRVKSPIKSVNTSATAPRRRSRPLKAVDKEPPKLVDLAEAFRVWRESFETPAKRQAYIEDVCRRIAEEFKPEKIILFGSHAYGEPTPESDLDLLVVMRYEGDYFLQASKSGRRLGCDAEVLFSVTFHYPGQSATKQGAKQAVQDCRIVRDAARVAFGLPV
ncbi:MAG: nucleotidyltransferase domain-containing protein [Blastocatellia bacterium]